MLHTDVEVRPSPIAGFGLFARQFIPKGTIVWWIDGSELLYAPEEYAKLPQEVQNVCYENRGVCIRSVEGGEYMNHSCDPNVGWLNDETYITLRDVQAEEELTYDYGTSDITDYAVQDKSLGAWACACGASSCRQWITPRDCLDEQFQERHKGFMPSWTVEFIEQQKSGGTG